MVVTYFGIHKTGGVAFLEQQKTRKDEKAPLETASANAFGLAIKSPFQVIPKKASLRCPHLIPIAVTNPDIDLWRKFVNLVGEDDLADAMLPLPHDDEPSSYYLIGDDSWRPYLAILGRMGSPIVNSILPIWTISLSKILDELSITNLTPLVLTGVKPEHTNLVDKLVEAKQSLPRCLVMVGADDVILPPSVIRVTSQLRKYPIEDLILLPWETMGAVIVRRHMRGEAIM